MSKSGVEEVTMAGLLLFFHRVVALSAAGLEISPRLDMETWPCLGRGGEAWWGEECLEWEVCCEEKPLPCSYMLSVRRGRGLGRRGQQWMKFNSSSQSGIREASCEPLPLPKLWMCLRRLPECRGLGLAEELFTAGRRSSCLVCAPVSCWPLAKECRFMDTWSTALVDLLRGFLLQGGERERSSELWQHTVSQAR